MKITELSNGLGLVTTLIVLGIVIATVILWVKFSNLLPLVIVGLALSGAAYILMMIKQGKKDRAKTKKYQD